MKTRFKPKTSPEKLLLVSAPRPFYNRHSIQIGTLKAFLRKKFPGLNTVWFKEPNYVKFQVWKRRQNMLFKHKNTHFAS
jgi:hypothetical protein